MVEYTISQKARSDIAEIISYIAKENPPAARKLLADVMDACLSIGRNPQIGQQRSDLTSRDVRFFIVQRNYVIIYSANHSPVRIVRVYNAARNISNILH